MNDDILIKIMKRVKIPTLISSQWYYLSVTSLALISSRKNNNKISLNWNQKKKKKIRFSSKCIILSYSLHFQGMCWVDASLMNGFTSNVLMKMIFLIGIVCSNAELICDLYHNERRFLQYTIVVVRLLKLLWFKMHFF